MDQQNKINNNIALVDLDGTLADYDKAVQKAMKSLMSPGEVVNDIYSGEERQPYLKARRKLIQSVPGFWKGLEPIALGFDIVEELFALDFDIHILTKGPSDTPLAWTEKFEWCNAMINRAKVTVTQDKSLTYGRLLVDDWPGYFESWLDVRPRGLVICVAQPWNAHVTEPSYKYYGRVLRYDGSNLEIIKIALNMIKNRRPMENLFQDAYTTGN